MYKIGITTLARSMRAVQAWNINNVRNTSKAFFGSAPKHDDHHAHAHAHDDHHGHDHGHDDHHHGPHIPPVHAALGKFLLVSTYFWLFYMFYNNGLVVFGVRRPWLTEHEHHHALQYSRSDLGKSPELAEEEHEEDHDEEEEEEDE